MIEPFISPLSGVAYRLFHQEPVDMRICVLGHNGTMSNTPKDPFGANQAIPTLLFGHERRAFEVRFPSLFLRRYEPFACAAYPLSGGFSRPALFGPRALPWLRRLERAMQAFGKWLGFRVLVVLERR